MKNPLTTLPEAYFFRSLDKSHLDKGSKVEQAVMSEYNRKAHALFILTFP